VAGIGTVRDDLLVRALADILGHSADSNVVVCDIVHESLSSSSRSCNTSTSSGTSDNSQSDAIVGGEVSSHSSTEASSSLTAAKRRRLSHEQFHNRLR